MQRTPNSQMALQKHIQDIQAVAQSNRASEHDIALCALDHIVDLCSKALETKTWESTNEIF